MENEKIQLLLESEKFAALNDSDKAVMTLMLENTDKELQAMLSEGSLSGDVAQFTPILMPMVRRVYPNLIANELLGVQPMAMPTGFIYALTNRYTGDDQEGTKISPVDSANLYLVDDASALVVSGDIVYIEGNYVISKEIVNEGATISDGEATPNTATVQAVYTNEAAFYKVLKNYTGKYSTAAAEKLKKDMREVGFSIARKSVAVESRALKGQYTVEMYQDLKSQHGLLADEEIMSLMSYEIQAEIDREIVDFVNGVAQYLPQTSFTADSTDGTGRWELEKYRREAIRISKESAIIGLDTKRGQGNIILCSPKVATMFEQVGSFTVAPQASNVKQPVSGGLAGTFDGKYKVIVDQYATTDYCTVIYKGADRRDAMGFFAPYVPLSFTKVTEFDSGQPAIIAKTRYAIDTIPGVKSPDSNDRAEKYARTFDVNFANTILA